MLIVILCFKKSENKTLKNYWLWFFSCYAVSNILGFIAHYYCTGKFIYKIIWIPLYAVMYETANAFFMLAKAMSGDFPTKKCKLILHIISSVVLLPTLIIDLIFEISAIRLLAAYALIVAFAGFVYVIRDIKNTGNPAQKLLLCTLLPILPGGFFQFYHTKVKLILWFNHNGLTHLCVIISVAIFFAAALKSISQRQK